MKNSLRRRLLVLGMSPLLLALPIIIAVMVTFGGHRLDSLLIAKLNGNLAGASNYLDQVRKDLALRVSEMVKSERLELLVRERPNSEELQELLLATARGAGFDYLVVADGSGRLIASSSGAQPGEQLPESFVVRQARIGVANSAYERVRFSDVEAYAPDFVVDSLVDRFAGAAAASQDLDEVLLINAGAHFPLSIRSLDAMLIGGVLLNNNVALIDHMREVIFPAGVVADDAGGMTSVYLGPQRVAVSRLQNLGVMPVSQRIEDGIADVVLRNGAIWIGSRLLGGTSYRAAYGPLADGDGAIIGMIGVGVPDTQYRRETVWLLLLIALITAIIMVGLSGIFVRAGRDMTVRLSRIGSTMQRVRSGQRGLRIEHSRRQDEIHRLEADFNALISTIEHQEQERLLAQKVIADEASRRKALFEHERDGVIILEADGSVFEANPVAARLLGCELDDLPGLDMREWPGLLGSSPERVLEADGEDGLVYETDCQRRDGTLFPAEVSVSRSEWAGRRYVLLLLRDITERKASELQLHQYRTELESLVASRTRELDLRSAQLTAVLTLSPDGFVSFDDQARVLDVNESFLRISGFLRDEVLGLDGDSFSTRLQELGVEGSRFPGVAALRDTHRSGAAQASSHLPGQLFRLQSPGERVVEVMSRNASAQGVSQVLYFRDVTHEIEVDRMKSEFLSTAAHELRTPMASIYGFAQLLLLRRYSEERRRELTQTIVAQSELMTKIINDLLDLARIESRQGADYVMERVDVGELLHEAVASFGWPDGRDAPAIEVPDSRLCVRADRSKVMQALLNLLSNAYKYSADGSPVVLRCAATSYQGEEMVCLEIIDHGIGMSPDELQRVFERFYRADRSGRVPGTGLGMSIVKEIVNLHGGHVEVLSQAGEGTTVRMLLPRI